MYHADNQSGQSLIEHSYKADSDLSPAGWEYAERLKAAVTARRKAARMERADKNEVLQEENPLIVRYIRLIQTGTDADARYGHQHVGERIIQHGHLSSQESRSFKNQSWPRSIRKLIHSDAWT
jgi:hypothetical protein